MIQAQQDLETAQQDGLAVLLLSTPDDVLSDPGVLWALAVVDAIFQRNYVQFVKHLQIATYVQACFLHMLFLEVRTSSAILHCVRVCHAWLVVGWSFLYVPRGTIPPYSQHQHCMSQNHECCCQQSTVKHMLRVAGGEGSEDCVHVPSFQGEMRPAVTA